MTAARGRAATTSGRCCTAHCRPRPAVRDVARPFRSRSGCRSPEGARIRLGSAAARRRAHRRTRPRRDRSKSTARLRDVGRDGRRSTHQRAIASLRCTAPAATAWRSTWRCSPSIRRSCPSSLRPCCPRTSTSIWREGAGTGRSGSARSSARERRRRGPVPALCRAAHAGRATRPGCPLPVRVVPRACPPRRAGASSRYDRPSSAVARAPSGHRNGA